MSDVEPSASERRILREELPELEIPGVASSELDEDLGELREVPDEESEEDAIEGIYLEIKSALSELGVEALRDTNKEEIIQLWQDMDMNQFLINDLVLHTTTDKRLLKRNEFIYPSIHDLVERSTHLVNPYDVRRELVEGVAPNLVRLGHRRLDAYRLPRNVNESIGQAWRVQGWLAGLPLLADLPGRMTAEMQTTAEHTLKPSVQFRITINEIVRQARIINSDETRRRYDMEIRYNAEAYADLQKSVKAAYKIANFALLPFAAPLK